MSLTPNDHSETVHLEILDDPCEATDAADWKLRRWLVSFRSGIEFYPVGEFIALDAAAAIARAIDIFGPGESPKAEEIPWDAAPLPRISLTQRSSLR